MRVYSFFLLIGIEWEFIGFYGILVGINYDSTGIPTRMGIHSDS